MKYFFSFFLVFLFSCEKKSYVSLDFCEIIDNMHQVRLKENQSICKPFTIDKIIKIEDTTIKHYLISNSKKFRNYNFNDYFINKNTMKNYHFKCDIIEFNSFNNRNNKCQTSKEQTINFAEIKYVQFFEPIFNYEQNEFILLIMEFTSDFKSNYRLGQYSLNKGEIKLIKELLVSN